MTSENEIKFGFPCLKFNWNIAHGCCHPTQWPCHCNRGCMWPVKPKILKS